MWTANKFQWIFVVFEKHKQLGLFDTIKGVLFCPEQEFTPPPGNELPDNGSASENTKLPLSNE